MLSIRFIFIGEGASDSGLIAHLETLCVELGADIVTGVAFDIGMLTANAPRTVESKLSTALKLEPNANLIFVHRDADGLDPAPRYREIADAFAATGTDKNHVSVVPVQETEAWILLDENEIRKVAGRPGGRINLNLPRPSQVESVSSPKERLKAALLLAAELTGRRRARFASDFSTHRRLLLNRLPTGGDLAVVPSWMKLRSDLDAALQRISEGD